MSITSFPFYDIKESALAWILDKLLMVGNSLKTIYIFAMKCIFFNLKQCRFSLLLSVASFIIISPLNSFAEITRRCEVAYVKADYLVSDFQKVDVVFMGGIEANKKIRNLPGNPFITDNYAFIWFKDGQVAILKWNDITLSTHRDNFSQDDFEQIFGSLPYEKRYTQINSKYNHSWKIRCRDLNGRYFDGTR